MLMTRAHTASIRDQIRAHISEVVVERVCTSLLFQGKYRKYNLNSLRDLLRVLRNKSHHFRELPEELQVRFDPKCGSLLIM